MKDENLQFNFGLTTEGYGFCLILEFAPDAPAGAMPIRITGNYEAADGHSDIDVNDWRDLPAVITESPDF